MPRRRVGLVLGAAASLALALATAACSSPSGDRAQPATRSTASASASSSSSGGIETECALVSSATSIMLNAAADRRAGRLTASEYAAVLNTVPQVLLMQPHDLPRAVARAADRLRDQVGPATAGNAGPAFDPRSAAMRAALEPFGKACDANGTPTGILAISGG